MFKPLKKQTVRQGKQHNWEKLDGSAVRALESPGLRQRLAFVIVLSVFLGRKTRLLNFLSPIWRVNDKLSKQRDKMLGVTCNGLASHKQGEENYGG